VIRWSSEAKEYGTQWTAGDVVGCCLDRERQKISFYLNGECLGDAFSSLNPSAPLFPCVSLEEGEELEINIGQKPFKFPLKCKPFATSLSQQIQPKEVHEGAEEESEDIFNLEASSLDHLKSLSPDFLGNELNRRGLKMGGNLIQRAERLWSVKGLTNDEIPTKIKAKKKKNTS